MVGLQVQDLRLLLPLKRSRLSGGSRCICSISFAICPSHVFATRRGRKRSPLLVCLSGSCHLGCTSGRWSPLPSLSRRCPSCRAWLGFVSGCLVPILFPYLCCSWWSCKGPGGRALPLLLLCCKVCVHRRSLHIPCPAKQTEGAGTDESLAGHSASVRCLWAWAQIMAVTCSSFAARSLNLFVWFCFNSGASATLAMRAEFRQGRHPPQTSMISAACPVAAGLLGGLVVDA